MLPQEQSRLRKRSSAEYYEDNKPLGNQDLDKEALLFSDSHQEYKPEYLELPIKVQGDMRHRIKTNEKGKKIHESSIESIEFNQHSQVSEQSEEKLNVSKESNKDLDELMNNHKGMDFVESLLMPFYEQHPSSRPDNSQYILFDQPSVKVEDDVAHIQMVVPEREDQSVSEEQFEDVGSENRLEELIEDRDDLMRLMNSFRAVNEATKVVVNYHKMGKKDPMNKVYSNIFSVLAKESRKLENQLEVDEVNLRMKIRAENAKIMKKPKSYEYDMNKQLAGTSEGIEPKQVKIEEGGKCHRSHRRH